MKSCLIGYTGFVGSNLAKQAHFDDVYNSANLSDIAGKTYDLAVCAGIGAVKWWANKNPAEDLTAINRLLEGIRKARINHMILISTIDVYPRIAAVDERFDCTSLDNHAYGRNRLYAEQGSSSKEGAC